MKARTCSRNGKAQRECLYAAGLAACLALLLAAGAVRASERRFAVMLAHSPKSHLTGEDDLPGLPAEGLYSPEEIRKDYFDRINPAFRFCVYPAFGSSFIREAVWREWGTEEAPLILASGATYGRPKGVLAHREALAENRRLLERQLEEIRAAGGAIACVGGVNPSIRGADPEFSGKNAVASAYPRLP